MARGRKRRRRSDRDRAEAGKWPWARAAARRGRRRPRTGPLPVMNRTSTEPFPTAQGRIAPGILLRAGNRPGNIGPYDIDGRKRRLLRGTTSFVVQFRRAIMREERAKVLLWLLHDYARMDSQIKTPPRRGSVTTKPVAEERKCATHSLCCWACCAR